MTQWWPLRQARLLAPRLEFRLPSESDLDALASLAAAGVHDPAVQPFAIPWPTFAAGTGAQRAAIPLVAASGLEAG